MTQQQVISRNGVPIRLTDDRWQHIIEEHAELAGLREEILRAIGNAERVLVGTAGELLAVRMIESSKAIVVVYREIELADGFVITAFVTRRLKSLDKKSANMATADVTDYLNLVPGLLRAPHRTVWSSYDAEADVLYLNFKKPASATDSELTDNDVILRYEGDDLIGLTVLHASTR